LDKYRRKKARVVRVSGWFWTFLDVLKLLFGARSRNRTGTPLLR
jgi:hypothetical protein